MPCIVRIDDDAMAHVLLCFLNCQGEQKTSENDDDVQFWKALAISPGQCGFSQAFGGDIYLNYKHVLRNVMNFSRVCAHFMRAKKIWLKQNVCFNAGYRNFLAVNHTKMTI